MALRTPLSVTPHLYMGDSTGRPLDKGVVYFGEQDKDPEFYPINLFSDDALTKPLAQPVHTKGGYLYDKGDMVEPHAKELIYSVKVLDSYGRKVFYKGAMMRNSWNDDVIEQINAALVSTAEEAAQIATDVAKEIADKAVVSSGFVTIDSFEAGATITQRNQALRHASEGRLYRWAGELPKVVPANSTPTSSGGMGENAWLEVSDVTLRQDLANPDMGATMVARGVVVVDSIADLLALPAGQRKEGLRYLVRGYYAGSDIGGGEFYWSGSSAEDVNGGTVFAATGVTTGRWLRPVSGVIEMDWFGFLNDGSDEQDKVQAAFDATPVGGVCKEPSTAITVVMDIPAGQSAGARITKEMTFKGNRTTTFKVKDFCSAWVNYTGTMTCFRINSSNAVMDGIYIDANADNHYETDVNGFKWWENGPELKRPPSAASISAIRGEPNVVNSVIRNCEAYRPLGGFSIGGALGAAPYPLDHPEFLNGTMTTNLCVSCVVENNVIIRARGNDTILTTGAIDCVSRNNRSVNSMYHPVRFYTATVNCHAYGNTAEVDYAYLKTLYNETDLGYWRTNRTDSGDYLIRRSGFRIGSGWSPYTSIVGCSMHHNVIRYSSNEHVDIIDPKSADGFAFQLQLVINGCEIYKNKSHNSPFGEVFWMTFEANKSSAIYDNVGYGTKGMAGLTQGQKIRTWGNKSFDNQYEGSGSPWRFAASGSWQTHVNNTVHRETLSSRRVAEYYNGVGNAYYMDAWDVVGYPRGLVNNSGTADAFTLGSETKGVPLTAINGWEFYAVGTSSGMDATVNLSGKVLSIQLYINGTNSTSDGAANIPFTYVKAFQGASNTLTWAVQNTTQGLDNVGDVFPVRIINKGIVITKGEKTASRATMQVTEIIANPVTDILDQLVGSL